MSKHSGWRHGPRGRHRVSRGHRCLNLRFILFIFVTNCRSSFLEVFSDSSPKILSCYFHMLQTTKRYSKIVLGGMQYIEVDILPLLKKLMLCSSTPRFERLLAACVEKWEHDGQHNFVSTWSNSYSVLKWRNWYTGSLPIVNLGDTNDAMESLNAVIKTVVSPF